MCHLLGPFRKPWWSWTCRCMRSASFWHQQRGEKVPTRARICQGTDGNLQLLGSENLLFDPILWNGEAGWMSSFCLSSLFLFTLYSNMFFFQPWLNLKPNGTHLTVHFAFKLQGKALHSFQTHPARILGCSTYGRPELVSAALHPEDHLALHWWPLSLMLLWFEPTPVPVPRIHMNSLDGQWLNTTGVSLWAMTFDKRFFCRRSMQTTWAAVPSLQRLPKPVRRRCGSFKKHQSMRKESQESSFGRSWRSCFPTSWSSCCQGMEHLPLLRKQVASEAMWQK